MHMCTVCPTQCVSVCFVSSRVCIRHHKDWDSPQLTSSEGAVQRLLNQWHLMSSISEKNPSSLPQDSGCLSSLLSSSPSCSSGSRLTVRNSAPDSAARGQTSTSKESTVLAFQVKETHSPPPGVNNTLFIILVMELRCSCCFTLLCRCLPPSRVARPHLLTVRFVVFWRRKTSGP